MKTIQDYKNEFEKAQQLATEYCEKEKKAWAIFDKVEKDPNATEQEKQKACDEYEKAFALYTAYDDVAYRLSRLLDALEDVEICQELLEKSQKNLQKLLDKQTKV